MRSILLYRNTTRHILQLLVDLMSAKEDPYKTVQPPLKTRPPNARRNNADGPVENLDSDAVERFKIREICEGWPTYRDAAEWENYRSMFHDDAYIATSWSQVEWTNSSSPAKKHLQLRRTACST